LKGIQLTIKRQSKGTTSLIFEDKRVQLRLNSTTTSSAKTNETNYVTKNIETVTYGSATDLWELKASTALALIRTGLRVEIEIDVKADRSGLWGATRTAAVEIEFDCVTVDVFYDPPTLAPTPIASSSPTPKPTPGPTVSNNRDHKCLEICLTL
jgi:hypothetical protein